MAGASTPTLRASSLALLAALIATGCGSSSASHSASPSQSASSSAPQPSSTGATVTTATGPAGTYLVGGSGRALYLWVADTGGHSSCSGACARVWPPLVTMGAPAASGGVSAADLGTIARPDGTKQVTYKGHPLYYFIADHAAGVVKGQGSDSFGAKWWLVAPSGSAITSGGAPATAESGGSSSASSAGSSGSSGSSGSGSSAGSAGASSSQTSGGGWS